MIFLGDSGAGNIIRVVTAMSKCAEQLQSPQEFDLVWKKEYLHTLKFLDQSETIQYQFDYTLRFVKNKNFTVNHITVSTEERKQLTKAFKWASFYGDGIYSFTSKNVEFKNILPTHKNKLVIYRDTFVNHDLPKSGKSKKYWNYEQWQEVINFLKQHFFIVEIEYRTPISEVMYHLATAEIVLGHDGMWHTYAGAFRKPRITLFHPKYASWVNQPNFIENVDHATKMRIKNYEKCLISGEHLQDYGALFVQNHSFQDFLNLDYFRFLIERAKALALKD